LRSSKNCAKLNCSGGAATSSVVLWFVVMFVSSKSLLCGVI
jgi:hypothetical protein